MSNGAGPGAAPPASRVRWLLAIPLLLAVAAYARAMNGEFQFDDLGAIEYNQALKDLGGYARGFLHALFHSGRPVTELTFAANYAVGRLVPWNFHVTNLVIHLGVVVLVFVFTRRVLRLAGAAAPDAIGVVVAGLFALHPLQSEAVSYLTQRAEALASGFYLAALLLLLDAERRGRRTSGVAAYGAGLLVFLLGLGSKVILVTLPAAYLLLVAAVPNEEGRRELTTWPRRVALLAPWLALDAYFCAVTLRGIDGAKDAGFSVPGSPPGDYFVTQWRAIATYLRLLFWPSGQNLDWRFPVSRNVWHPVVLGCGLLLLALLVGAVLLFRRNRRRADPTGGAGRVAAFGILWFFLLLAPTSSFAALADALAEHRVYLPSWGVLVATALLGAWLLQRLGEPRRTRIAFAVVALAWALLAAVLYQRNAVWESRLALWEDSVAKEPRNWRAHMLLGQAYRIADRTDDALGEYRAALQFLPAGQPRAEADILANAGVALMHARRLGEALQLLLRAEAIRPGELHVLSNLAVALLRTGDLAGAEQRARRAVEIDQADERALEILGEIQLSRGDPAGAVPFLERSVRADPDEGTSRYALGAAYWRLGRAPEACASWRQVLLVRSSPELQKRAAAEAASAGCPGF